MKKQRGGALVDLFSLLLLSGADQTTTAYQGDKNVTQLTPLCPHVSHKPINWYFNLLFNSEKTRARTRTKVSFTTKPAEQGCH